MKIRMARTSDGSASGVITLYRGEGSHDRPSYYPVGSTETGAWWTTDLESAKAYAAGQDGLVYVIDVDESEAERRGLPQYRFIPDPEVRKRRRVLESYASRHTAGPAGNMVPFERFPILTPQRFGPKDVKVLRMAEQDIKRLHPGQQAKVREAIEALKAGTAQVEAKERHPLVGSYTVRVTNSLRLGLYLTEDQPGGDPHPDWVLYIVTDHDYQEAERRMQMNPGARSLGSMSNYGEDLHDRGVPKAAQGSGLVLDALGSLEEARGPAEGVEGEGFRLSLGALSDQVRPGGEGRVLDLDGNSGQGWIRDHHGAREAAEGTSGLLSSLPRGDTGECDAGSSVSNSAMRESLAPAPGDGEAELRELSAHFRAIWSQGSLLGRGDREVEGAGFAPREDAPHEKVLDRRGGSGGRGCAEGQPARVGSLANYAEAERRMQMNPGVRTAAGMMRYVHEPSRSEYGGIVVTDPRMVAYDGEREVGSLDWDARDPRIFGTVRVDPAYRGRGIATRLFEEAKKVNPDLDPETSVFFTPAGRGWVDSLTKTAFDYDHARKTYDQVRSIARKYTLWDFEGEARDLLRRVLTEAGFPRGEHAEVKVLVGRPDLHGVVAWDLNEGLGTNPLVMMSMQSANEFVLLHEAAHILRNGPSAIGRVGADVDDAHDQRWWDTFTRLIGMYATPLLANAFRHLVLKDVEPGLLRAAATTGISEIDALIEDFKREPLSAQNWGPGGGPVSQMSDPYNAHGYCQMLSEQFVEFAKRRGFRASTNDLYLDEIGYTPTGGPYGEVLDADGEIVQGYYPEHTVAVITVDDGSAYGRDIYIDFTAAQYGYTDFPKVTGSMQHTASVVPFDGETIYRGLALPFGVIEMQTEMTVEEFFDQPQEDIVSFIMEHFDGTGVGNHWSTAYNVSYGFANDVAGQIDGLPVLLEGTYRSSIELEDDEEILDDWNVYTDPTNMEKEVTIREGEVVTISKVYWGSPDGMYGRWNEAPAPSWRNRLTASLHTAAASDMVWDVVVMPPGVRHDIGGTVYVDKPGLGSDFQFRFPYREDAVGLLRWYPDGEISDVWVHPDYRRQGLATEMLRRAREAEPYVDIHHSEALTSDGQEWSRRVAAFGDGAPVEPGTSQIPSGATRLYHVTHGRNLASVLSSGLLVSRSVADMGAGSATWASRELDYWRGNDPDAVMIEFYATPDQMDSRLEWSATAAHVGLTEDIPPSQFVAIHEPWHTYYRSLQSRRQRVLDGEFDHALGDETSRKAIEQIKREGARHTSLHTASQPAHLLEAEWDVIMDQPRVQVRDLQDLARRILTERGYGWAADEVEVHGDAGLMAGGQTGVNPLKRDHLIPEILLSPMALNTVGLLHEVAHVLSVGYPWVPGSDPTGGHDGSWRSIYASLLREYGPGSAEPLRAALGSRTASVSSLEGLDLRFNDSDPEVHKVTAHEGGVEVGSLWWWTSSGEVFYVHVSPSHQRKGIATGLWGWVVANKEPRLHHSSDLTEEGRAWSQTVASASERPARMVQTLGSRTASAVTYRVVTPEEEPWIQEDRTMVRADVGVTEVGHLIWDSRHGGPMIDDIWVHPGYRRQGIATKMLQRAREVEPELAHSTLLTGDGRAWSQTVASAPEHPARMVQTYPAAHGGKYHARRDPIAEVARCRSTILLDVTAMPTMADPNSKNHPIICPRCMAAIAKDWQRSSTRIAYQGGHRAPSGADDVAAPLHDVEEMMPDYYEHPEWYSHDRGPVDAETSRVIRGAKGQPDKMITIYRALPPGFTTINDGDWVTISRTYALGHAMQSDDPSEDWPVITAEVPARTLWTEGYAAEWGYDGSPVSARLASMGHTAGLTFTHLRGVNTQDGELVPVDYPNTDALVAREGGKDVGFILWYAGGGMSGSVDMVWVDESHRRKGLATELLRRSREIQPDIDPTRTPWFSDEGKAWVNSLLGVYVSSTTSRLGNGASEAVG